MSHASNPACQPQPSTARVFNVRASRKDALDAELATIQKRLARRGLDSSSWAWSWGEPVTSVETHERRVWGDRGPEFLPVRVRVTRVPLTLPKAPSFQGWRVVATLDHSGPAPVVFSHDTEDAAGESYRDSGPLCEHCGTHRRRNTVHVLRHEDGRSIAVGSTCIEDFTGSPGAERAAEAACSLLALIQGDGDEGYGGGQHHADLSELLAWVSASIRAHGWTSRTSARENGGGSTSDDVSFALANPLKVDYAPTEADYADANAAVAWGCSLSETERDYLANVRAVALTGSYTHRTLGLAASILVAHRKALAPADSALPQAANVWIGEPKEKGTWSGTLVRVGGFHSQYGYTTVLTWVEATTGATLVWKTGRPPADLTREDVDTVYEIKATIKGHTTYRDTKQTNVVRAKVTPAA